MKIAYFDCFSGISGDMIVGALIDLGLDVKKLKKELEKIDIKGYRVKAKKVKRKEIGGTNFEVGGGREKRNPDQIIRIIEKSRLSKEIKNQAKEIFSKLGEVEKKIHGGRHPLSPARVSKGNLGGQDTPKGDENEFDELGEIDTIIDVISTLCGIKMLGIEEIYSSPIPFGKGFLKCSHGILPVPAPATAQLLEGAQVYGKDIKGELTTPTGAVLIRFLAKKFGKMPEIKIEKIGYGAGTKNLKIPNLLRVIVGEKSREKRRIFS